MESSKVLKIIAILVWAVGGTAVFAFMISEMVAGSYAHLPSLMSASFFSSVVFAILIFVAGLLVWLQGCKYARKEQKQTPTPSKPVKQEQKKEDKQG